MNQEIKLKIKKFPSQMAELMHSNQFLKMSAFCSYGICAILLVLLMYLSLRPTSFITLAPDGSVYQFLDKPNPEVEIEKVVRKYIEKRYNWEPKSVLKNLEAVEMFIPKSLRKSFMRSMSGIVKFSTEKQVSQRAYPFLIKVILNENEVHVSGDRITAIQGIKAAGNLNLKLLFESGPRTKENPWGIYILKETEVN